MSFKRQTYDLLHGLAGGADPETAYHADASILLSHPWNELNGLEQIRAFWQNIQRAFPDMERRDMIFVAGHSKEDHRVDPSFTGRPMVASLSYLQGTFEHDLLNIPATKSVAMLRMSEAHHVRDGKIAQSYMLIDLLDLMDQAGVWPLPPSAGAKGIWPGPSANNGVRPGEIDETTGAKSFDVVMGMHRALLSFDGKNLDSMDHSAFWTDNFMYYGGAGIGACRGLTGFRAHHQIPFLKAFPDRKGAGHFVRIGDGNFAVTGGWPSVQGTHSGPFLGMTPTGRQIDMRVMDFYHLRDGKIAENWLPIDIPHMAHQMGLDLFEKLDHMRGKPSESL